MAIQPYLFFEGRCNEAIEFYTTAFGGKLEMKMTYGECPEPLPPDMTGPDMINMIMHASMRIGDDVLMLSDGNCKCDGGFKGFSLSYTAPDAKTAEQVFNALCADGNVTLPLGKTFWSPCFGMVQDKFGVGWMVTVPEAHG